MTLREWRRKMGWDCATAARHLGIGLRDYQLYEAQGYTLRNVPLRPQVIYPT